MLLGLAGLLVLLVPWVPWALALLLQPRSERRAVEFGRAALLAFHPGVVAGGGAGVAAQALGVPTSSLLPAPLAGVATVGAAVFMGVLALRLRRPVDVEGAERVAGTLLAYAGGVLLCVASGGVWAYVAWGGSGVLTLLGACAGAMLSPTVVLLQGVGLYAVGRWRRRRGGARSRREALAWGLVPLVLIGALALWLHAAAHDPETLFRTYVAAERPASLRILRVEGPRGGVPNALTDLVLVCELSPEDLDVLVRTQDNYRPLGSGVYYAYRGGPYDRDRPSSSTTITTAATSHQVEIEIRVHDGR